MNQISTIETPTAPPMVGAVFLSLLTNPLQLITRWNWKAALFSSLMRSPIFFALYFGNKEGLQVAAGAALLQFAYRALFSGVVGSLIQSFRAAQPFWLATLTVLFAIPAFSHLIEFILQTIYDYFSGAKSSGKAVIASIAFSVISAIFNLFAMRHNVMTVGEKDSKTLWQDIKSFPQLIFDFVIFLPLEILKLAQRGQVLTAIFSVLGIGLLVGASVIAFYGTERISLALKWSGGTIAVFLLIIALLAMFYRRQNPINP